MSKVLICLELGVVYRLDDNVLEFAPIYFNQTCDEFDEDDFSPVEPDLVGEELVNFNNVTITLNEVFGIVTKELRGF